MESIASGKYTDHPRRCGENVIGGMIAVTIAGSPPQVRGKRDSAERGRGIPRITPAGAGKTADLQGLVDGLTDHPRRCGENERV